MTSHGYIYVRNWQKRQHHKYESPPWHKVYNSLLTDDDYLSLSAADRGVLHALWMLTSLSGDGRLSANSKSLARRLNVRRVSLEPLIQAGFIEVLGTKRVRDGYESVTTELEKEKEHPLTPASGGNGFHPDQPRRLTRKQREKREREQKRMGAVQRCRYLWHQGLEDGELEPALREHLEREYRHDPTIVTEAIGQGVP